MTQQRSESLETLQTGVRRVIAPNPSPMTYWGTNSYIVGRGQVAVIDPGPDDPSHLQAILATLGPEEAVSHILVTHSHVDHSLLVPALSAATGAPVLAYGATTVGRSTVMSKLAASGLVGGGEGVDADFAPDQTLADGQLIQGKGWEITALWTPGHIGNHMCFQFGDAVFTGDHIMGWASSLVSPPDGDLTDFMTSTRKLADLGARVFYPGHGAPVTDPAARCDWLISHRLAREAAILEALSLGPSDVHTLTAKIYADTDAMLIPAAQRNVLAHLVDLVQRGRIAPLGALSIDAKFALT